MNIYHLGAGLAVYVSLYIYYYCKKTQIIVKSSTKLGKFLSNHVPAIRDNYHSLYWCPEGRIQTIFHTFVPFLESIKYDREVVPIHDGGQIYLDWFQNDNEKFPDRATRPTVFVVPGLTSTSSTNYVKSIVYKMSCHGYRCIVIVNRGLDGMEILTPKAYCATHTMDMEEVIKLFKKRYPNAPLAAVGISLGSLMVGHYIANTGDDSQLAASVLYCCPFSTAHCSKRLETWSNKILFTSHLTQNLVEAYHRFHHKFRHIVDHEEVVQTKSIREFDSAFTAKVFGYDSVDHYYNDAAIADKLTSIKIPTLCVNSDDDPFSPVDLLPTKEVVESDNVALVVTRGGGHVSHLEGFNPFAPTYFEKVLEQFIVGAFENSEAL